MSLTAIGFSQSKWIHRMGRSLFLIIVFTLMCKEFDLVPNLKNRHWEKIRAHLEDNALQAVIVTTFEAVERIANWRKTHRAIWLRGWVHGRNWLNQLQYTTYCISEEMLISDNNWFEDKIVFNTYDVKLITFITMIRICNSQKKNQIYFFSPSAQNSR